VAPPRIFISYRRDDASGHAGRLYDALESHFGRASVFMDVDTIRLGSDFAQVIEQAVAQCDVVVVLMGRQWITGTALAGQRRLDDPDDFVRLELESALAHDLNVVPVAVQGTAFPTAGELPASLEPLSRRQGIELRDTAWHDDVQRLIRRLERLAEPATPTDPRRRSGGMSRRRALIGGGVLALLVAVAAGVAVSTIGGGSAGGSPATSPGRPTGDPRLLAAIPGEARSSCHTSHDEKSAEASVDCSLVNLSATYNLFPDASTMRQWYAEQREAAGIDPGSGRCIPTAFRGEAAYTDGRHVCFIDGQNQPEIVWTDAKARIGASANIYQGEGVTAAASLLRQWNCCLRPNS